MTSEKLYEHCTQCPRACGANRLSSDTIHSNTQNGENIFEPCARASKPSLGFCYETDKLRIASATLHFGEEPPITVFGGSGTIFFTGCTLHCAFCQNYQISELGMGSEVSETEFVEMCLRLQNRGAENINLVTGSHHIPRIADFIRNAKNAGVSIPFCWNSSAYESVETLELLRDLVTIWLPDFKTKSPALSEKLFFARDYPAVAMDAISWMIKNFPLEFVSKKNSATGEAKEKIIRGVIVRHLFLPGKLDETIEVLDWLKKHADGKALISLMSQYTPIPFSKSEMQKREGSLSAIENRLANQNEAQVLRELVDAYNFSEIFFQELVSDTSWLPDFSKPQPFSNALATPLWHWKTGFSF